MNSHSGGGGGFDLSGVGRGSAGSDPGTDCEDELSTPAGPPADVIHRMDSELEEVFGDVGSLPTMVTPVCDIDGALRVSPAEWSSDCTSCRVGLCDSAVDGYLPGRAENFVSGTVSSIAGVGGCFVCAPDVSGGSRSRGVHAV